LPRHADDPKWNDPGLLVLGSLADGAKHGLAILADLEGLAGTAFGPGTLYGVIARLESRGLIERLDGGDARRHPYQLTARGAEVLRDQLASMERFAARSTARLRASAPNRAWGLA